MSALDLALLVQIYTVAVGFGDVASTARRTSLILPAWGPHYVSRVMHSKLGEHSVGNARLEKLEASGTRPGLGAYNRMINAYGKDSPPRLRKANLTDQ